MIRGAPQALQTENDKFYFAVSERGFLWAFLNPRQRDAGLRLRRAEPSRSGCGSRRLKAQTGNAVR